MKTRVALLFIALTLGLAWAIRGHFGHEHGAAWAGAIAGIAVILASGRTDWANRLPVLASLSGIGWGVGGMMSYGIIVGYGRGLDFLNVYYGLSMLGIVGGLYGFIGGGLFGLGLEPIGERRPQWASLLCEMVCGGLLSWWVLIVQLGWRMTPPRSELWAACLGAALALAWFLQRNGYANSLRVAFYSALGAGFGFGFGNFLQTLGSASGIDFNWWNVMEFSLGFFGGLGMAYGVFSRKWPESMASNKSANWLSFLFLFLVLPLIHINQSMTVEKFTAAAEGLLISDAVGFANRQIGISYLVTVIFITVALLFYAKFLNGTGQFKVHSVPLLFFWYLLFFLVFSHIIKMVFIPAQQFQLNMALYWVVFALLAIIWLISRMKENSPFFGPSQSYWKTFTLLVGLTMILFLVCSFISIRVHHGLPGFHERF